jgi:hypothetical protein
MAARRQRLFYVGPDLRLMTVSVTDDSSFAMASRWRPSTAQIPLPPTLPRQQYSVTAKGDRFLVSTVVEPSVPSPVTVVLNWDAALKK